jgi:hypothetical protein
MNFLKSIICFLFKHDVSIYSDKSACSITCKRCDKVIIYSTWENLTAEELCLARKYFGNKSENCVWIKNISITKGCE